MEQVREAAQTVGADSFIERLPDGYDTVLEQGGMEAQEAKADSRRIQPSPLRCPLVRHQSLPSVPFIFFGLATTPPRPGRDIPFRFAKGAV